MEKKTDLRIQKTYLALQNAFEALLDVLGEGVTDEDELNRIAQRLDSYMNAQADFLEASGLAG